MRCFVAAFLELDAARDLHRTVGARAADPLGRSIPVENYHVTLRFLGEIAEAEAATWLEAVAGLGGRTSVAQAVGFIGLPRSRAARVIAAELLPEPLLGGWARQLAVRSPMGRPFRPHVTVARLRRARPFAALALRPPLQLTLAAPGLYRSDAVPGGVRYRPVAPDLSRGP